MPHTSSHGSQGSKEQPNFLLTAFSAAKNAANLIAPEEYNYSEADLSHQTTSVSPTGVENNSQQHSYSLVQLFNWLNVSSCGL